MHVKVFKTKSEASDYAFQLLIRQKDLGPSTYGLATGSTPLGLYQRMVNSEYDFSQDQAINLDEYVGLSKDHPQSYAYFMNQYLFSKKPFKATYIPNGVAEEIHQECLNYDQILEQWPIDLQILGLGSNGHIGFNEPGSSFDTKTHCVQLTESTIKDNQRFFENNEKVPNRAITMGIDSILKAKQIILMAFGENKAHAIRQAIELPASPLCPASCLQQHANTFILLDEEAASQLIGEYNA